MPNIDIEGRFGPRLLLRAGLVLLGTATGLWMLILGLVATFANSRSDPVAAVLLLTSTIMLWPAATVGLLLLLCWLIMRIAAHLAATRKT